MMRLLECKFVSTKKLRRQRELPTLIEKMYKFIGILTGLQKISTAFGNPSFGV